MENKLDDNMVEIGGQVYTLKLFPTMVGMRLISEMMKGSASDDFIMRVVTQGASIGSVAIDEKKFNTHFRGKYKELFELSDAVLKFNKMDFSEGEEGKDENDSEE